MSPVQVKTLTDLFNATAGGGANRVLFIQMTATQIFAIVKVGTAVEMWTVAP